VIEASRIEGAGRKENGMPLVSRDTKDGNADGGGQKMIKKDTTGMRSLRPTWHDHD